VTEPCADTCDAEWDPYTATRTVFHNLGGWTITVERADVPGDLSVGAALVAATDVVWQADPDPDPDYNTKPEPPEPTAIEWDDASGECHLAPRRAEG
jgi:hypothetical protein